MAGCLPFVSERHESQRSLGFQRSAGLLFINFFKPVNDAAFNFS